MTTLDNAYSISNPDECRRIYADWAASYDAGFARDMDYRLPAHVAAAFLAHGGAGPLLDVGAGTGLLARSLRDLGFAGEMDAVDFSPEMLATAAEKGLYRALFQADITAPMTLGPYQGITSSGTFTKGHVGPDALPMLEAVAAPGALIAISINNGVYQSAGFETALARRPDVSLIPVPIYGPAASGTAHAADTALIAIWRHQP